MEDYVQLNHDYQILICRLCQVAVRPGSGIESHFRRKHQLKGQILKDIKDYYSTLELADLKLIAVPEDNSPAIKQLAISDGYSCCVCRYLTIARDNIVRHWREAEHTTEGDQWTKARLQTWIGGRNHARYWIVRDDSDIDGPSERSQSTMDQIIAASQAQLKEEDAMRLRKGDLEEDIDRDSAWAKRLKWVQHFGSRDLLSIHDAAAWSRARAVTARRAQKPDDEEATRERQLLGQLEQSFDRERLAGITSIATRGVPFSRKGKEASMKAEDSEEEEEEEEEGTTSMHTIIGWMAYGKGHRQKTGGQPSIRWADDGEALSHIGEHISVDDFTRTLRREVIEAQKLLNKLFGGVWHGVSQKIDTGRIADNMIRLGAGQSFASNPKNDWLEPGPAKVMRLMESSIWDAARVRWKQQGVKKWLRSLRLLRQTLLVLVHTWGGLPGRGPEITTLRHCDSWQLIRNIFIIDGQVMIVTDRDKMKAIRDNGQKVAQFVPDQIGRMIVAYIAWLLPTERVLRRECKMAEPRGEQLEYMWRDGSSAVWDTERPSRKLACIMQAGTGVRLGVGRYWAVAIEMGRRIRGLVMKQLEGKMEDEDEDDDVEVDPMTEGSTTEEGSKEKEALKRKRDGQVTGQQQEQQEADGRDRITSRKQRKTNKEGEAGQKGKGKRLEEEMTDGLQRLLGPNATWRSDKQAESMRSIMALKADQAAINVLPTGAGKSILFMLPAVMQDTGTSIVVVPFVALMDDLVTRAIAMGVDCIRYRSSMNSGREGMPRSARLIVVSADIVSSAEFCGTASVWVPGGTAYSNAAGRARGLVPRRDAGKVGGHSAGSDSKGELSLRGAAG
ncbi:recQ family helicase [Fusarium austroafricanum]|uniref:DNA 3'-5' helicase n=1 Tax=Fusarium austroafricanum TaxID=2364996 RepID=A0A8H4NDG4_9HYPO|nr:recQ family helicase [Fusarium austroafricanum]